jgi:hypothetical protein
MNSDLKREIERLVADLSRGRFAEIASDGRAGRLSAEELKAALDEYGRTLVPLPEQAWNLVDEYPQPGAPNTVVLDVPLWTMEEGRSDLTLSLTATEDADKWILHIDDLHVL